MLSRYRFDGPSLIIADVESKHEGKYTCEVMTSLDMANATVSLIVVGKIPFINLHKQGRVSSSPN